MPVSAPRVRVHGGSRTLLERLANLPVRIVAEAEAADLAVIAAPAQGAAPEGRVVDANGKEIANPGWTLGLPRLTPTQPEAIARAARVTVPTAAVTGAVLLLRPLQEAGILSPAGVIDITASGEVAGDDTARAIARHCMLPVAPRLAHSDGASEEVTVRVEVAGGDGTAERARAVLAERYQHANHIRIGAPGRSEAGAAADPDRIGLAVDPGSSPQRLLLSASLGTDRTNTVIQVLTLMLGLETADEAPLIEQTDDQ